LWRNPPDNQLVSDRFLQILLEEGLIAPNAISVDKPIIHLLEAEKAQAQQTFRAASRPLVFLIPDSAMPIKRWSKENFVTVGKALQQQYNATIVVPVGDDEDFARHMTQAIGERTQILQRGTLRQLAAGLAHADLAIAVDTGPARIAAALNVPTITLFGPSWSGRYGQSAPNINLQGYPDCPERVIRNFTEQRCWYSGVCPFDWNSCTEEISAEQVLEAAAKFLNRNIEAFSPLSSLGEGTGVRASLPFSKERQHLSNEWKMPVTSWLCA
jgi:ADP-heptose:LPS heptosyltransferase